MTEDRGATLLSLARAAIAEKLDISPPMDICTDFGWLHEAAASFVTLHRHGALRGCIGSLEAYRPLVEDVRANAVAAAFHDPRFPPLSADEFNEIDIEVSVLSALQPVPAASEADAIALLKQSHDGVVLEYGRHRSTFLPQVWQQLPEPARFLAQLKLKAGLAADFWHADVRLSRYKVEKFAESCDGVHT